MIRARVYLLFLSASVTPFCAYAKRKVEVKLEGTILTLKAAKSVKEDKENKPLFVFANQSEYDPLIKLFFNDNGTIFTFDASRMEEADRPPESKVSPTGGKQQHAVITESVPSQEESGGQENMPEQEKGLGNQEDAPRNMVQDIDNKQAPILDKEPVVNALPSYQAVIAQMTPAEARTLLQRQAYTTQAYYMTRTLWKGDPTAHAKALVIAALEKLGKLVRIYSKKKSFTFTIDIENKVDPAAQLVRPLYDAVKNVGVIGFDMPNLDVWYVRHKGKLALGAVSVLALLAFSQYGNVMGTAKSTPVASQPAAPSAPTSPSWVGRQTGRFAQYIANLGTKHGVTEAAKAHGVAAPEAPSGIKAKIEAKVGQIAHNVAIRHQAKLIAPAAEASFVDKAIEGAVERVLEGDKFGFFKERYMKPWLNWKINY